MRRRRGGLIGFIGYLGRKINLSPGPIVLGLLTLLSAAWPFMAMEPADAAGSDNLDSEASG